MLQDRFLVRLIVCVVMVHLMLLGYMAWRREPATLPARNKVKVHTVQLAKTRTETARRVAYDEKPSKPAPKRTPKVAKTQPKKTHQVKTKPAPEKKQPKKTPAPKKEKTPAAKKEKAPEKPKASAVDTKRQDAVKKAQASLAQLNKESHSTSANKTQETSAPRVELAARASVPSLASNATSTSRDSYEDELTQRLRMELRLPEHGEVRIALTLSRDGQVKSVEVFDTQSAANRKYVQNMVPALHFSGFGKHFPDQEARRFVLVLTNDL